MKEKRAEKATPGKACKQGLRQWGLTGPTLVGHESYFRGARVLLPWSTGPTSVEHGSYFRQWPVLLPTAASSAPVRFCSPVCCRFRPDFSVSAKPLNDGILEKSENESEWEMVSQIGFGGHSREYRPVVETYRCRVDR